MEGYRPLDLTSLTNADLGVVKEGESAPRGELKFHGLPFLVGSSSGNGLCFIALGGGSSGTLLDIPIGVAARHVIVAHRLLRSQIMENGPVGNAVAEYVFHISGQESVSVPIRERFEIATVPDSGGAPFNAFPDQKDGLQPRYEGRWEQAGRRQMESSRGASRGYVLWDWENPHPDAVIEKLQIVPAGPGFIIAGITLGHLDERPFSIDAPGEVIITLPQPGDADAPFDLEVEVDRGIATYPYPLPRPSSEEFVDAPEKGWGQQRNDRNSPAYVEVAATPSATVKVKTSDDVLGEVKWSDLTEKGEVDASSRLNVRLVGGGRNWVHTNVMDDATGKPVPCRVHFRSPDGIPYAPHGHHAHVNSDMGTWHIDVGGDVRLGQISYAYIDGTCQGWLPQGDVIVEVARGYEYEPIRQKVHIQPGQRELNLRIKRWYHANDSRWFSGDSHVHFLSTQGSHTEAQGEDLNVVNLLPSQWGTLFTNSEEFTGRESVSPDGNSIVYVGSENRQHFLGHLILLGLKETVMPWCSDGPSEAELGGTLEVTMSDWADRCHAQGGTVIIPHLPSPNGEPAALIATGRADAVEMLRHGMYNHLEYYRYLNGGYKLPLVGGTDKMSSDVPVGIYRTYVYIPPDEPFTYESWCRNLTAGRTYHSGGPILDFTVDGRHIGDTIALPGNGGIVEVTATAESILPIHSLEVVQEGRVVASTEDAKGARKLTLKAKVEISGHSWLALRCGGPGYTNSIPHHDGWGRGLMAHTSPIYIACGEEWWMFNQDTAQYMLTMMDGCITYIGNTSRQHRSNDITHHHGEADHQAYLERPFEQARTAIHKRMHALGITH